MDKIQDLQNQINILQEKVNNFYRSSTIDRDVETALKERLGDDFIAAQGLSTASTQSVSVPSTPTNITVPAQPSGTLTVVFKGNTYNLLYK